MFIGLLTMFTNNMITAGAANAIPFHMEIYRKYVDCSVYYIV